VRPLDQRLLHYARSTRVFLGLSVLLGVVTASLVISQAWLVADIVSGAFGRGRDLSQLSNQVVALAVVVVLRAAVAWGTEVAASRSSARAKSELRTALIAHVARRSPLDASAGADAVQSDEPGHAGSGQLVTLATRGIDALDGYFARYLPQLNLAVIVPLTILVVIVGRDWISAAIIAVTLPLIPVFMALIGATTGEKTARQLEVLARLSGHFLDVVAGLPTLKVFGRAKAQAVTIREVADRYRQTAMATLRVTFLSSLVLELLSTVSVALVAVAVGLRLLNGHLGFETALFVLVLAPEAYLPLRLLGANYHASSEGIAAAGQVFELLEQPAPSVGRRTDVPDPASAPIAVNRLSVAYPGRPRPAIDGLSCRIAPGRITAISGPSGCGKSTLLSVLLGFVVPESGSVHIGSSDLADLEPDRWRERIAWVPQRPHLFAASLADNVGLGRRDVSEEELLTAITAAGLADVVARLPEGLSSRLGEGGAGLSAGERQRVALARAFLRHAPLVLLDEPTANLDGETEARVLQAVQRLVEGRTVILVAHRPSLLAMADDVIELTSSVVAG